MWYRDQLKVIPDFSRGRKNKHINIKKNKINMEKRGYSLNIERQVDNVIPINLVKPISKIVKKEIA